jgi:hypothetical protein
MDCQKHREAQKQKQTQERRAHTSGSQATPSVFAMIVATGLLYERTSTGSLTSPGVKHAYDPPNGWIVVTPPVWPSTCPLSEPAQIW